MNSKIYGVKKRMALAVSAGAVMLTFTASPALAVLEEVVVTAQKRSESLQDVPIAVVAYTGDGMKALGIDDATDLVNLTPGLQAKSQSGSNRNYFLRGVGTNDTHLTAASAVGQYIDGITLTSGFHGRAALYDMERVEILKGPQNALFGLNTTGGAVNYITKKPEIGAGTIGDLTIKMGSNSLKNIEGAVGFDMGQNAAGRISIFSTQEDGAFDSLTSGKDMGDDDTQSVRAQMSWAPTANTQALVNVYWMESENNGTAAKAVGTRDPNDTSWNPGPCSDFNPLAIVDFERTTSCLSRPAWSPNPNRPGPPAVIQTPGVNPSQSDWETVDMNAGGENLEVNGVYLKLDHDLDWGTFTSITSYASLDVKAELDIDATPLTLMHFWQSDDRDTFQQEFRLVSDGGEHYRWIAGAYWLDDEASSYTAVRGEAIQFGFGNKLPNVQLSHTKENVAVYFQGEYDVADDITFTAGARWSDEEIVGDYLPSAPIIATVGSEATFYASDVDALVAAQFTGQAGYDANGYQIARQVKQKLTNEDIGYTFKLDYKMDDDSLVYLSHSRGFKGAALDIRAVFALVPVGNVLQGLEDARLEPESLDVWELGYKGTFMENRVQLDASVYSYSYENLQQFITLRGVPTLDNAPESEIKGFDANIKYAGDSGLYLQAGLTYLDTEVTDAENSAFAQGADLAAAAQWSYTALISQDIDLNNGALLTMMANISYTGETANDTFTTGSSQIPGALTIDDYTIINANVTYRYGPAQKYAVSLFGNNLTEERFCSTLHVPDGSGLLVKTPATALHMNATCRVSNASTRTIGASFSMAF